MAETTITTFCRPVFNTICAWSEEIEQGGIVDAASARTTLSSMLDEMRANSRLQPQLGRQFLMVELPLLFFIDFVMKERMGLTGEWQELAFERNELAGDEKFFDLLEQTLGDPTDLATERVHVFYQCMLLGFTGAFRPDAPELDRLFRRCTLRLGLAPELVETGRVTPEAYGQLDTRTRRRPLQVKRWRWATAICLVGFLVIFVVNDWIFRGDTGDLRQKLLGVGNYSVMPDGSTADIKDVEAAIKSDEAMGIKEDDS